ncbi:MAG TPA: carboxypeptidase-like regulatory domain-containing protein [Candidatus Limnocylindrales bacterium]|nr:carboxypeptidase-like regulatory domain-containing protein [Candidatus Limnocylindrales bacterium]
MLRLFALGFVFAFLSAGVVRADNLYASIRGQVTDQTKAAVPGAEVTATNTGTNEARVVTTQADGSFEFLSLPIGTYNLSVKKGGFQAYQATGITLVVNQIYVLNPTLEVGASSQTVTVEAAKTQVDTTSMQLGTTVEAKTIVDMPLNGRNWVQLQQLQPGVVASSDRFASNYATNGSQSQQNSYLINGTDSNDLPLNTPLIIPSPDAIQEFRMITNTINPEYGRNSGAILDAVIKSGTNQFHGDAFEFYRDTFLNTRNFFQRSAPVFHQNQYGGTIGGPIWKNHTFGFFSYQGTKNVVPQAGGNVPVYSAAELAGTFNAGIDIDQATGKPYIAESANLSPIPLFGDSASGCPYVNTSSTPCAAGTAFSSLFSTGVIPTQDFNTLSTSLVTKYVPAPNCGGDYCFNPQTPGNTKQYIFQINQNLGEHDTLWFLGFMQNALTTDTLPFIGASLPGFGDESTTHSKQFTGAWNHIFSANTLNEFRIGYTRLNFVAVNPQNIVLPSALGFNINPQDAAAAGVPYMGVSGLFNLGFSQDGPQPRIDQTKQVTDNFSHIYGNNTLKFGVEFRDFWVTNPFYFENNGAFAFNRTGQFSTGDPGANFLLGFPQSYVQSSGGFIDARAKELYSYAQDEYKLRQDLTLTFGMGYQIDTPLRDIANGGQAINCFVSGQQSVIFPSAPQGMNFPGDPNCPVGGYYTHYNDWAPRLGFAWAPNLGRISGSQGNFSIRGGVGIYYNRSEEELTLQNLLAPPFALFDYGVTDAGGTPSFSTPFTDVQCISQTGTPISPCAGPSIANKYPFTPPAVGSSPNFGFFEPMSLNLLDPNTRVPTAMNYNLTVQREIPGQIILSIGYVGAEARHLMAVHELNPLHNSTTCAIDPACVGNAPFQQFGGPDINGLTVGADPYYYPTANALVFASLAEQSSMTNSNYNSLQISANKALSHGLSFLASYTWAHSLDFGSSYENSAGAVGLNPFNFHQMYGNSAFDAPQRFVFSYDYRIGDLSHVAGFHWLPSRVGGGWHVSGITTFQSGFPITISDSGFTSLQCSAFEFYSCWDRPNVVSTPIIQNPRSNTGSGNFWFNGSAFAIAPLGTVGNEGRNNLRGPGINDWDMALMKDTQITESTSFEMRIEFYNLFNHTQFNAPLGNIQDGSSFGQIFTAGNGRLIQLAAKFYF